MKRHIMVAMSAVMALSSTTTILARDFNDTSNSWAKAAISEWSDYGVVSGYTDGSFKPSANITRAELATLLDKVMKYEEVSNKSFNDLDGSEWYADSILKNVDAGNMNGYEDGTVRADRNITRQETAVMLCNAFDIEAVYGNTSFADDNLIPSWSKPSINALQQAGYVNGRTGNMFAPTDSITRAEVVTMLDNIVADLYSQEGTYTKATNGNVLVNTDGVTLKDTTVTGDLFVADSVSGLTLDNVQVSGDIVGNANAVKVVDNSQTTVTEPKATESESKIFKQTEDYSITLSYMFPEAPTTVVVITPVKGEEPKTGYKVTANGVTDTAELRADIGDYIAVLDGSFTVDQIAVSAN